MIEKPAIPEPQHLVCILINSCRITWCRLVRILAVPDLIVCMCGAVWLMVVLKPCKGLLPAAHSCSVNITSCSQHTPPCLGSPAHVTVSKPFLSVLVGFLLLFSLSLRQIFLKTTALQYVKVTCVVCSFWSWTCSHLN